MVSTFRSQCGIATYTEALTPHLTDVNVTVLAEAEPSLTPKGFQPVPFFRTWNRGTFRANSFVKSILDGSGKVDVVHFQHEYGLFPNSEEFLLTCKALKVAGVKVIVTLHTVHAPPNKAHFLFALSDIVHRIIVHTPAAAAQIAFRSYNPIEVIPHGVHLREQPTNAVYNTFLCPGFISESKGHQEILEGYAAYVASLNGIAVHRLNIVGLCRDMFYQQKLDSLVNQLGLEQLVKLDARYLHDTQLIDEVTQAAAVILGSGKTSPYSASGQLAIAIGCGKPVIAKNVPIYNNTPVALYSSPAELAILLKGYNKLDTSELKLIASARGWPIVAQKHMDLYKSLCHT